MPLVQCYGCDAEADRPGGTPMDDRGRAWFEDLPPCEECGDTRGWLVKSQ